MVRRTVLVGALGGGGTAGAGESAVDHDAEGDREQEDDEFLHGAHGTGGPRLLAALTGAGVPASILACNSLRSCC